MTKQKNQRWIPIKNKPLPKQPFIDHLRDNKTAWCLVQPKRINETSSCTQLDVFPTKKLHVLLF